MFVRQECCGDEANKNEPRGGIVYRRSHVRTPKEGGSDMRSGTVIWLDVFVFQILATVLFDWLLLWATAAITRVPTSFRRIVLGAVTGAAYYIIYVLSRQGLLPHYRFWSSIPVVVLISLTMLFLSFHPLPLRRLFHVAAHFYGIGFISAGVGTVTSFLAGRSGQPDFVVGFLAAGGAILLVAELGWGAVQRQLWQQLYQMPLEVMFDGVIRSVTALVDTGNRLRDPLTGEPVIVIERECVQHVLPRHLQPSIEQMATGDLSAVTRLLASEKWSARFRIIPFSSLGNDHGLLVGFRPDAVRVTVDGEQVEVGPCILGICKGPLDPDGVYKALIHPELVQTVAAQRQRIRRPSYAVERRSTGDATRHSQI